MKQPEILYVIIVTLLVWNVRPISRMINKVIYKLYILISESIKKEYNPRSELTPMTKQMIEQACETHDKHYNNPAPVLSAMEQPMIHRQVTLVPPSQKKKVSTSPQTRTIQQQRQLIADFLAEKSQTFEADKTLASKYNTTVVTLEKYATDDQMDQWESIRAICMAKPRTPSKETLAAQQQMIHPNIPAGIPGTLPGTSTLVSYPVEHHVEARKVVEK